MGNEDHPNNRGPEDQDNFPGAVIDVLKSTDVG